MAALTGFAEACFNDNSVAELREALAGPADATDCETWGISADEWRAAIEQALAAKRGIEIVDQFSHLNDTDAGRDALDEYERAIESGKDHDEAEIMASNVLQRAGFNVNAKGGVTIRTAE